MIFRICRGRAIVGELISDAHYENNLLNNRNNANETNHIFLNAENKEINQHRRKCCKCY